MSPLKTIAAIPLALTVFLLLLPSNNRSSRHLAAFVRMYALLHIPPVSLNIKTTQPTTFMFWCRYHDGERIHHYYSYCAQAVACAGRKACCAPKSPKISLHKAVLAQRRNAYNLCPVLISRIVALHHPLSPPLVHRHHPLDECPLCLPLIAISAWLVRVRHKPNFEIWLYFSYSKIGFPSTKLWMLVAFLTCYMEVWKSASPCLDEHYLTLEFTGGASGSMMTPVLTGCEEGSKRNGVIGEEKSLSSSPLSSPPPPPPLRFSSYSLLEGGETAAGSLGLPTGALFSPFSKLQPLPPRIARQPVLCIFCSAYPNPFCTVDANTGGWRCCFCLRDNPCYAEDFIGSTPAEHCASFPEMTYKAVEYCEEDLAGVLAGMSSLSLATGPHRRRDKGAAAPAHVFVVDGNMRDVALADLARSIDEVLGTMEPEALISLVVFTGVVSVYRLGRVGAAVADVFPGSETLSEEEVARRLAEGDRDHFLPVRAGRETLCTIMRLLRGVGDGSGVRAGQQHQEGGSAEKSGTEGLAAGGGGGEKGGGGGRGGRGASRRRTWGSRRTPVPAHRRRRCLGAAVEYALSLAQTADRPSSRLLVCLGGCPNFGPGAVTPCVPGALSAEVEPEALAAATDYFEDLGDKALQQGTGVDVFCGGSEALGAAALQGLVAPTGGYVLVQPSFAREFAENLGKSIGEQVMSDGDGLHGCVIDVRASAGVELMHVVGPAESTEDYDNVDREAESASMAAAKTAEVGSPVSSQRGGGGGSSKSLDSGIGRTYHRLVAGRADPRTSLALYFDGPPPKNKKKNTGAAAGTKRGTPRSRKDGASADAKRHKEEDDEHVVFQFVTRWSSPNGDGRVTRVMTHRIPVTSNQEGFLQTVDPEAVAVLVGKEAVLRATFGSDNGTNQREVEEARVAVDTVVQEISSRFRYLRTKGGGYAAAGRDRAPLSSRNTDNNNNDNNSHNSNIPGKKSSQPPPPPPPTSISVTRGGAGAENVTGNLGDLSSADVEGGEAGRFVSAAAAAPGSTSTGSNNNTNNALFGGGSPRAEDEEEAGEERGGGEEEGPEGMVFPRELGRLPLQLFHLRRGPLLGPLLQNSDDPLCLRHLFLRGGLEECLRMMAPVMWSLKGAQASAILAAADDAGDGVARLPLTLVPVETLAMLSDRVLVLDTHDRIFVWSGAAVCGPEFDAVRMSCEAMFKGEAAGRYPSPPVVFLKDGTSWSRYLTSRLIPSHKDPIEEQLKGFPELEGVPAVELERLRAKLPPTDDESYREFFWDVCQEDTATAW